ncbi:MAG: hypothetical protein IJ685_12390 [Selenomonadaceae bacterium]|nr:hypothetical protein [Selenomonadaceae bacterium]
MSFFEKMTTAFEHYATKNFDAALTLIDEMEKSAPDVKRVFMLEAWIYFERGEYLRAFDVLIKLLPRLDLSLPYEKLWAAQTTNRLGQICDVLSLTAEAVNFYRIAARLHHEIPKICASMSNAIFVANALENFSREDFNELYAEYKNFLSDIVPFEPKTYNHKKIRVGFLSADFHQHPVTYWSFALLTQLDKKFFDTYFYSAHSFVDDMTQTIQATAHEWRDIEKLSDENAAKIIRDDEIDILFDLSGHTAGNRLRVAAYRPATVQISGIGYINSTGLDCFDYFLSDVHCAGDESWFTEKLIRMPQTHFCYNSQLTKVEHATEPPCLRKGYVTFGSFNNFVKVTDKMLSVWKKILDRVPNSRLLLKHKVFNSDDSKNFISERLKTLGFDVSRVDMRGYSFDYLEQYNEMDIALDTFPYTGGVTTCEAFWMGVPVVSLYGDNHGTRFGLSMLTNVGLPELAVDNVDEYISRAVMLANDFELLTLLRRNLRGMMKKSPLMDGNAYVREIEKIFAEILLDAQKRYLRDKR